MQQKREDSLNKIRLKLNEINQVKYDLRATNEFKPNSTLFNQNEASFFGSNVLYEYLSMSLIKSQLLNDEQQLSELIQMTNLHYCIVVIEMALSHVTFIQSVMVIRIL